MTSIRCISLIASSWIWLVLATVAMSGQEEPVVADAPVRLPSIWLNGQESGGQQATDPAYRIRAELLLFGSNKTFLVEEFVSSSAGKFRMDVIEASSGRRATYFADSETGEKFYYEPFRCLIVDNFASSMDSQLADKFHEPKTSDNKGSGDDELAQGSIGRLVPTGIGSLWILALRQQKDRKPPAVASGDENKIDKGEGDTIYTAEATEEFPYKMNFHLRSRQSVEPDSVVAISLLEQPGKEDLNERVVMRVRLLDYEGSINGVLKESPDLFQLPLGYGCKRKPLFENQNQAPPDFIGSRLLPHVLRLDIVALQPSSSATSDSSDASGSRNKHQEPEEWRAHSTSVRLAAGRLRLSDSETRDYLVMETRDFAPERKPTRDAQQEVTGDDRKSQADQRATLRRVRQVWDLGPDGLSSGDQCSTNNSICKQRAPAFYFELDDRADECLGYGESRLSSSGSIEFPRAGGGSGNRMLVAGGLECEPHTATGINLNTQLVELMFGPAPGYHLIREAFSETRAGYKEFTYEQRVESLDLSDSSGSRRLWSGPVSIVRRHHIKPGSSEDAARRMASRSSRRGSVRDSGFPPEASVTLHFLSPKLDQLRGRLYVQLSERRDINQAALRRDLDVGACFNGLNWAAVGGRRSSSRQDVDFRLEYPSALQLDSSGSADSRSMLETVAGCSHCSSLIEHQFLRGLFSVSGGRLDPLQLTNVKLDFGTGKGQSSGPLLQITGKLVKRPSLLDYRREQNRRFASGVRQSLLFSELQPNEASCAESCHHYNCSTFAYCKLGNQCDLFMGSADLLSAMTFENTFERSACAIYRQSAQRRSNQPIEPVELLHKIRETILQVNVADKQVDKNPLTLVWVDDESDNQSIGDLDGDHNHQTTGGHERELELVPSFVEWTKLGPAAEVDDALRPEYELIGYNKAFKSSDEQRPKPMFPVPVAKYFDYEDCRQLCDQTDCLSFSHCQIERTCQVSQLHDSSLIEEYTGQADYCSLMVRDSLSKFQNNAPQASMKLKPISDNEATQQSAATSGRESKVREARDCANRCMSERDFKCRSFYFCEAGKLVQGQEIVTNNCYLRKSHFATGNEIHTAAGGNLTGTTIKCQLYTRSHLSEFDRFYRKSLPKVGDLIADSDDLYSGNYEDNGSTLRVLRNSGAEACSAECASSSTQGECLGFQVCRSVGPRVSQSICGLLLAEPKRKSDNQTDQLVASRKLLLSGEQLVVNENCTTFLLDQKSELRGVTSAARLEDDDDAMSDSGAIDENAASSIIEADALQLDGSDTNNWPLAALLWLGLGLAIGYVISFAARRTNRHSSGFQAATSN